MPKPRRARRTRRGSLPEDILVWEILVRLPPKHLLRCRAVCRAWRRVTSTREFLLVHHGRQPSLPILRGFVDARWVTSKSILAFDHRAAPGHQLQPIAQLDGGFSLEASCNGLLLLSYRRTGTCFTVCNPTTGQHASLDIPSRSSVWGMYQHRPTGDHRILLHRHQSEGQLGCYVFTLGSDQPTPRYVGGPETSSKLILETPALLRDSLHWLHRRLRDGIRLVLVFDTTAESFRQMRVPLVPRESYIFEVDDTLAIYGCNRNMNVVKIWVLHDYTGEVWEHEYSVKLPVAEIMGQLGSSDDFWNIGVVSVDGDVLLLISHGGQMFYVDTDGELVDNLRCDGQQLFDCGLQLKQSLVQQAFFPALEDYAVNSLPFVLH